MWGGAWGGACGAALAALLLLLLCRRRAKPPPAARRYSHPPVETVVVGGGAVRAAPCTWAAARAPAPPLARAPPPARPPPAPPAPPAPAAPSASWLHKRPLAAPYASLARPLAHIVPTHLGADLNKENRKFSATRSPSLEKDDKSPFLARDKDPQVFGFDAETVRKLSDGDMDEAAGKAERGRDASPTNLRRFMSVSTRLHMCTDSNPHPDNTHERSEMQNSPRVLECSSAKEKSSAPKFDFSPKILADSFSSPRFFTPPEMVSPMFFRDPSPKSVYYDSVRSPKFFPETPREPELSHSPKALGEHLNRSNGVNDKQSSPRVLSARPSPKLFSSNKENYFSFDHVSIVDETASRLSPRPRKYGGRSSLERERYTPPVDKDVKKYRRHNSCDTNYRSVELNITKCDDNKELSDKEEAAESIEKDVVDCCVKMDSVDLDAEVESDKNELTVSNPHTAHARRQRLKSISLDSENAKIIEQNLGIPVAKQMKDQMNEAFKNHELSTSCESMERYLKSPTSERPSFKFDDDESADKSPEDVEPKSPDIQVRQKKSLRQSSDTQSFLDMPRFSPKEFEITITSEEGTTSTADAHMKRKGKNLRNLTIDLTKRDSELEKELLEFEKLYTDAEEKKVKTPTLKVKATSLDSSETVNLSLPQKKTLDVPQNSVSVPNTPKRQIKRILAQKTMKHDKMGFSGMQCSADQRRLYMKGQDSGIFLRENHATLMLYQPGSSRMGSRTMGSFDENIADLDNNAQGINVCGTGYRPGETVQTLGANLINYKQNLSVSSTNLKTLPEGVTSDNFEPSVEDEKLSKKLHRRNSNQSLMLSTHSLQSSNCSLSSAGASCHNLSTVRTSISNFSLNSDGRQKRLSLDRRDSYTSPNVTEHLTPTTRVVYSSNTNVSGETSKNCLLQRRGSNNSLTLNICSSNNLSRHSSNSSLNKEAKPVQKKGLLERRSSNTSLTLNINSSNPQLSVVNRGLSISNYNLNGSTCNLSRYNSNQSIDNATVEHKKGILERRSSNTSLTLNIQPLEPRDLEIDETLIDSNLKDIPHRDKHRKSLSTENLIPKSYKTRTKLRTSDKCVGFGSHDNLWSTSYTSDQECTQNLTYVGGDQENEIIYAFGHQEEANYPSGFVRNITTKPLSPQSTSEDFRAYLANMQHLQNASSVLSRQQLRDLNEVFQNGYSKVKCLGTSEGQHCCSGRITDQTEDPEISESSQPCSEYQKMLLRNLHQEFWDMPTNFQEKPIVSGSHVKNRYKTILPNEHSRFILKADSGVASEGYINANYIKGHEYTKNCYIATQGPLPNTIHDFWRMVAQSCTGAPPRTPQRIVMLTNFVENNRHKCEQYFPLNLDEEITFPCPEASQEFQESASFIIKNTGLITKSCYTIRRLEIRYGLNHPLTVYHYWFHSWADHKCPKDVNALLSLSLDILKDTIYDFSEVSESDSLCQCTDSPAPNSKFVFPPLEANSACPVSVVSWSPLDVLPESSSPPTIVHCSAGVGRTGCLLAILAGMKQLASERRVDVLGIVCNLRLCRGGMVQTSEQYELVHKVLAVFEHACLPPL